ncbi:putative peptidase C2 family protein [Lyophyllum shimeji]|uniref:Peptidase C2 family protein n=1 Tax=Lyophyllum shimeji TaxID=47721 RepID=A0A9P3UNH5_LYOSH|nr:putative peptidase C2 family protein [Lyophyllum shimeji]
MSKANRPVDHEADLTYSKAAKAELSRHYDPAFRLYVKSAELYLHLSRSGSDSTSAQVTKWKANAGKALQRAEKIKAFVDKQAPQRDVATDLTSTQSNVNLTPVGIDHFSTQEQAYVLRKGGSVNGLFFPLWDAPVDSNASLGPTAYEDPDGQPKLSAEQAKVSPVWRRLPPSTKTLRNHEHGRIFPREIVQHVVTDCSVCASISVLLEHSKRFNSNLAETAVHRASSGRYDIKVLFNGAWRRIGKYSILLVLSRTRVLIQEVVDDRLPYHPVDGRLMCMSVLSPNGGSAGAEPILWPSILEKGYMKLLGGYDFPGSNSSIDLHAIAGWIPEHMEIEGPNFEQEKSWDRILEGFLTGRCVLTLGTGTKTRASWLEVELLPSHSYAVIDVIEENGARVLTVLDTSVSQNAAKQAKESSTLQIPWSDVLNIFDGIYLSWDPSWWPKSVTFHGIWKRKGQDDPSSTQQVHLRFAKRSPAVEQEIWVLLTRHVTDSSRTSDFISLKVEVEDELRSTSSVTDQTTIAAKGTYTNSSHVLVRTRVLASQPSGLLSIFTSYDGDATEIGFTLSVFASSDLDIAWDETVPIPPHTKRIEGVLTSKNAGGNCTYPTFMLNPQYQLQIRPRPTGSASQGTTKARVALTMQASRDMPINVSLAYSQGGRIDELVENELAASSGAYSYGLARVTKEISPGDYNVILSAFEPRYTGPFSLKIDSSLPFELRPIPQEDAGMYTKVVRGAWKRDTAVGGPTSDQYSKNPIFEIDVPTSSQLKIRLQLLRPYTPTLLNITIFPSSPDGSLRRHITTSGAYNDSISGVATPQVSLLVYTTVAGVKVTQRADA